MLDDEEDYLREPVSSLSLEDTLANSNDSKTFPLRTQHVALKVNDVHTEFIITPFSDHLFIAITQTEKLGTLFQAYKTSGEMTASGEPNYSVTTLLGKRDDDILNIYARQIIELVGEKTSKPLILALALQDSSKPTFRAIMEILSSNSVY
eukprot:TRINITY_DN15760_c0_g1_i1.p1 TRINITY_DN15760_c0_g1~~TRINITY_DN15760_c0_g1_i1.p1  ORF type:complete len:150 (+),score=16.58 TRINITY_DN15760_c0_g1_i1:18-467(+)